MQADHNRDHTSPVRQFVAWWSAARDRWARLAELHDLPPGELQRVARDMGVSPAELLAVAAHTDDTQGLLERRLAALALDPEEIRDLSPALLRDLQRTCATCQDRGRCIEDMKVSPLAPGWESYCPNSGTLRTLI